MSALERVGQSPPVQATGRSRTLEPMTHLTPTTTRALLAERLAHEAPLAVGTVLFEAHERARRLQDQLELEAADPRVDELYRQSKALRKAIAALLVEVAVDAAATTLEEVVPSS